MDQDESEIRPSTAELAPDVWAARLIDGLEGLDERVENEESVADEVEDEAAWAAALAAANARAEVEPVPEAAPEVVAPVAPEAVAPEVEAPEAAAPEVTAAPVAAPASDEMVAEPESPAEVAADGGLADGIRDETGPFDLSDKTADGQTAPAHDEPRDDAHERAHTNETAEVPLAVLDGADVAPLVEPLRAGRALLCLGPRLSDGVAIRDLIARLIAMLSSDEVREVWPVLQKRPLSAAGFVVRRLGDRFPGALRSAAGGDVELTEALRLLGALPFRGVVSARCDRAAERAFAGDGDAPPLFTPRDGAALRAHGKGPFVLKLFGDPARPESLVLSHEAMQTALADGEYRAAAHELWRTRSFLFVGFQPGDLELSVILERLLAGAPAGESEHFAIMPGASVVEREELMAGWRIRVLDGDVDSTAHALHAALAAHGETLPADDDTEGWLALYAADPTRADAQARLDHIAVDLHERGDHEGLLELTLGRVDVEPEPSRRALMLLTLARLFAHEADDAPRALTALVAAYREDPAQAAWHELSRLADAAHGWDTLADDLGDAVARLPLEVRVPLLRKLERWPELVQALDALAATGGDDARAHQLQAAQITVARLDDRAGAIARYEALVAESPGDLDVLRALDGLYAEAGRQLEYLENLERQADAVTDRTERAALFRRLALSWEEEREGALRAEQCWQTLLTIEPEADDALRALERCYRASHRYPALIEALRRRAELSPPPAKVELYCEIGSLWADELHDRERAIEAYLSAESVDPTHLATLAALGRLFDETGAWHLAVNRLVRRAKILPSLADALPLYFRAGELCADRLDDKLQAETHFARVLEIDPAHVPSMLALAALHKSQGAPLRAARFLVDACEASSNALERTRLCVEAAALYESVDDEARATELYLTALSIDPERLDAAAPVADLLWRAGRFTELVPVLEMLTRKDPDSEQQLERLIRLARAARSAELGDKSARAWARAAELEPRSLDAQRGHAETLLATGEWVAALGALEKVFQYHVDALAPAERATLFFDMARCEERLGARQGAREFVARALEHDPTHRQALLLQTELCIEEPEALIEAKRALAVSAPPAEQVKLLDEIGDLCMRTLADRERAVGAWAEALEIAPEDHRILHKCLDAFVEDRAWPQALEMLERLVAVEKDDRVRAKYHHAAALICRDELGRGADAAAHLRAALDDDPALERSAKALEEVYLAAAEWAELARLYRRRLKTLGPESPGDADGHNRERLRVWTRLGELCIEQLGEPQSALAAFEAALVFDRDNLERRKRVAELYVQSGPDGFDKAIAEHHHILRRDKSHIASYRALKQIYFATGQREKSLLCSYALEFLRKGDPDDARKVAEYKQRPFVTSRRVLDDGAWALLAHPDEDRLVDQLFALVGPTIAAGHAQPPKLLGVNRKEAIAADDRNSYAKALTYVATTLDVAQPEAYARPDLRESVTFLNAVEGRDLVPVFQLGQPLVGDRRRDAEQVFELARRAALLRPERFLRLATPHPQQIGHVIDAAVALAYDVEGAAPSPSPELGRTVGALKRALPPLVMEQVVAVGRRLRDSAVRTDEAAVAWLAATDLTALRAGFALVGDLETCARLVAADGRPAGARAPTERLLDLVWSTITEEMFAVRRHLGLV